jgi:hypothetical protein
MSIERRLCLTRVAWERRRTVPGQHRRAHARSAPARGQRCVTAVGRRAPRSSDSKGRGGLSSIGGAAAWVGAAEKEASARHGDDVPMLWVLAGGLGHAPGGVLGWVGVVGEGFLPASLETLKQSLFGGCGDMGVRFLDFVLEDVAEAECLGGFGDAVVDHPGFVAVAQTVKSQPGFDRVESDAGVGDVGVAVGGGAERSAGEVTAPVQRFLRCDEHVLVCVGGQVCA